MSSTVLRSLVVAALLCAALPAHADVMIKMKRADTRSYEVTLYLKGTSQRRETSVTEQDGRRLTWAHLIDCARHEYVWLDLTNRRYSLASGGVPVAAIFAFNESQFPAPAPPAKGRVVTETLTVTDTGERRELFGFTARHLKTLITWSAMPEACDTAQLRMETDGWYVNLLYGIDCSPDISGSLPLFGSMPPSDKCARHFYQHHYYFQHKNVGPAQLGFPLTETTKVYGERGLVTTHTQEVLALSTAALDDALFAVPAGYVRVEPEHKQPKPSLFARALAFFGKE